jgi:hypothetical protein
MMTVMKMRQNISREQGSILVAAVVFAFAAILIGVTYLSFAQNMHHGVSGAIRNYQATLDAYSGALQGVVDRLAGRRQHGWREFYGDGYNMNFYDYDILGIQHGNSPYGAEHVISVLGKGKSLYEGIEGLRNIELHFTYESFADFLYLSHKERDPRRLDNIYFWWHDTLDGKVHSNDTIWIQSNSGSPLFKKRVTTSAGYIYPPHNQARFEEGWGYRTPIIFPDQAEEIRQFAGLRLGTGSPDSLIQMILDGDVIRWRKCGLANIGGEDSIVCYPTTIAASNQEPIPSSGVVFVTGKLWLSASRGRGDIMDGAVPERVADAPSAFVSRGFEGQLTIASSDTMVITDNIVFTHARPNFSLPTTMDTCSELLGLVSENYIMIHRQVRDTVYINAAMAAIKGSISVQDIYAYGTNNEKQSLFVHGSLAQRNRGIVHTTYQGLRGFIEKDYRYDVRLREFPPPHYLPASESEFFYMEDVADIGGGG